MERPASFGAGETEKPSGANARRSASLLFTLSAHLRRARARAGGLHAARPLVGMRDPFVCDGARAHPPVSAIPSTPLRGPARSSAFARNCTHRQPLSACRRRCGEPSPGADVAWGEPSPRSDVAWGEPSPRADVAWGEPSPRADVAWGEPSPRADAAGVSPVPTQTGHGAKRWESPDATDGLCAGATRAADPCGSGGWR
jgi:hypothetical protein